MADYEDYEDVIFPDFNEFTLQFEKEEKGKGKGKSDPNIHQKTKAKSDPNMDCPQPPYVHPCPFRPPALALHDPIKSWPDWKWIPPVALELQNPINKFCRDRKWIPETELCEQERNEFSLNGQSLLERYNEIKGTNFEFVRLVKIQMILSSGMTYFIQFEAKPSSTEYTLKTFEGSMFEDYVYSHRLWPMSCKLLGPNSQRYVCRSVGKYKQELSGKF